MEINKNLLPEVEEGDILEVVKVTDSTVILEDTSEKANIAPKALMGDTVVDTSPLTGPLPALKSFLMQKQSRADQSEKI